MAANDQIVRVVQQLVAVVVAIVVTVAGLRWGLARAYGAAVRRRMSNDTSPAAATPDTPLPIAESSNPERLIEVLLPSDGSAVKTTRAMLARRRRWRLCVRVTALLAAATTQTVLMHVWGWGFGPDGSGLIFLENIISLAVFLSVFPVVMSLPGLLRSGQVSGIAWWLIVLVPGALDGLVLAVLATSQFEDSSEGAPLPLTQGFAVMVVVGLLVLTYLLFVAVLEAAYWIRRGLRVSNDGFVFLLAGTAGAAMIPLFFGAFTVEAESSARWAAVASVPVGVFVMTATMLVGAHSSSSPGTPHTLLFLRTFGSAKRSNSLLRAVCRDWLSIGEVHLIVGPDLAPTTADARGVVRFITGRLGRHFVSSTDDLERRLATPRRRRRRDGRYDVREFPCLERTWRSTVLRLTEGSHVVLMDLRDFSAKNAGIVFELSALAQVGALKRTLFVMDASTDRAHIRAGIRSAAGSEPTSVFILRGGDVYADIVPALIQLADRTFNPKNTARPLAATK